MKGMQKVQPYVKIIQERHKGDRQKMTEEMMELYRKHNVSPMGGCLPMLLQIPVFIALYHALFFSIELRGAPFMLWITDLSEKIRFCDSGYHGCHHDPPAENDTHCHGPDAGQDHDDDADRVHLPVHHLSSGTRHLLDNQQYPHYRPAVLYL